MLRRSVLPVLAIAAGLAFGAQAQAQSSMDGVWRNAKDSVHVQIRPCGAELCGYVVWASPKAQADAARGGTKNLIGLQLLRDFVPAKGGGQRGKVFVPDLNATFSGSAELVDSRTLKAKGCLIANLICKTQTWTRIDGPAG